jgi:hypothetical protein
VLGASLEYLRRYLSSSSCASRMATLNGLGRIVAEAEGNFVKRAAMPISKLLLVDVLLAKSNL